MRVRGDGRSRLLRRWPLAVPFLLLAAGFWTYHNSFACPFIFDDHSAILTNSAIRHLWPVWDAMHAPPGSALAGRPLATLTFALNYAFGRLDVWSYHFLNLVIHLLAALVLFGLARRTLCLARVPASARDAADGLACAIALLWLVHPLQTQCVTYLTQRTESLAALGVLLTLYCATRAVEPGRRRAWSLAAVLACLAGMASKPVAMTAPLVLLAADRIFWFPSWRAMARERGRLYAGLVATWALLPLAVSPSLARPLSPWAYARVQPGVLLHYLRLTVWPRPLCVDYAWPTVPTPTVLLATLAILALLGLTIWSLRAAAPAGFLGLWVAILLAPTSSVFPVADIAEQRMYLPLAGLIALGVIGGWRLLHRLMRASAARAGLGALLVAALALALGTATRQRNQDYATELAIWQDTVTQQPENVRARCWLAIALIRQRRFAEADVHLHEAQRLRPGTVQAYQLLSALLQRQRALTEALDRYAVALSVKPEYAQAYTAVRTWLDQLGHPDAAIASLSHFMQAPPTDGR